MPGLREINHLIALFIYMYTAIDINLQDFIISTLLWSKLRENMERKEIHLFAVAWKMREVVV